MTSRSIFLFIVVTAVLSACSPSGSELDFIGYPIINGSEDTSQAHMAVVGVRSDFGLCTGTLIHDRVVMTAAHCVDGSTASVMDVGFGNSIYFGATWVDVAEVWQHPGYSGSSWDIENDIALLRLEELPPANVTPIPHLPYSLRITSADIGTTAEYVGFGQTSANDSSSAGIKMAMTNQIEWVCYSGSCSGWGNPGQMNTFCEDQSPSGVCFGDSGGPALITRSGTEYAAGIASYVGGNCRDFGCHTKVDEFESYILQFIILANGEVCLSDSECQSGICEDGVCCSTSCTGECMACDVPGSLGRCVRAPNGYDCSDWDKCDGTETCQNGVCTDGPDLECDDDNVCTTDSCDPSTGCVYTKVANGTSCDDGDRCNGEESCHNGSCRSFNPLDCSDGDPCTQDVCHPQNGCSNPPAADGTPCGDNNECNGEEVCRAGQCQTGTALNCNDNNSCTADRCIPGTGCVHDPYPPGTPCDDGAVCTVDEVCVGGECVGREVDCDDHNLCTTDSCDPVAGCVHTTKPDGTGCGGGVCGQAVCSQGVCEPMGTGLNCEDYDPCTRDWCDPEQGCLHEPLPDGYECGQCDMCLDGQCVHLDDCGDGGGCGCGGDYRRELPLWMVLLLLVAPVFRKGGWNR